MFHFVLPFLIFSAQYFLTDSDPQLGLLPKPDTIIYFKSPFLFNNTFEAETSSIDEEIIEYLLSDKLPDALPVSFDTKDSRSNLLFINNPNLELESYILKITEIGAEIHASSSKGHFYGLQTLKQIYFSSYLKSKSKNIVELPGLEIHDKPRFSYRGMHLDVSRHFFSPAFIMRYLDMMAYHKLNTFHWHLTDDQGWRIEIKRFPELTNVGSIRSGTKIGHASNTEMQDDNKSYAGYYTQDEIREIIQYASVRQINIIPEIEMPGHAMAALASYPEFSCDGFKKSVATSWGVFEDVFCTKDEAIIFLEEVLDEVMALFPGKYIHIGGDECPKTRWRACESCQKVMQEQGLKNEDELQSYFIRRIEKHVNKQGKSIIGWDEILEGGIAPNATVMSWRGMQGGVEAAKSGHDVIMSPTSHCYFDYYQSEQESEPLAIGGFIPLKKVYTFEPVPEELNPEETNYILGAQANVWTEYISSDKHCEYMVFPRLCALSEVNWSQKEKKDWTDFKERLVIHQARLEGLGINYANHLNEVFAENTITDTNSMIIQLKSESDQTLIYYAFKNEEDELSFSKYNGELILDKSDTLYFFGTDSMQSSRSDTLKFEFLKHKAFSKKIDLSTSPDPLYPGKFGKRSLVDGARGGNRFNGLSYIGIYGESVDISIDLDSIQEIHYIGIGVLESQASWIYFPASVQLMTSQDGIDYSDEGNALKIQIDKVHRMFHIYVGQKTTRFIKLKIFPLNPIPKGYTGSGNPAWLFLDEIIVE